MQRLHSRHRPLLNAIPQQLFINVPAARGQLDSVMEIDACGDATDHAIARGLVSDLPHATRGHAKTIGQPVRFDGIKPIAPRSAPALGADGPAILARLGITHD